MPSITTFDDVSKAQKRSLPIEERPWIQGKVREAEAILEVALKGTLADYIAAADTAKRTENVKLAVIRMVSRVVKNPDGLYTETDGGYSYGRDKSLGSGEVYASKADLQLIGIKMSRRARTIRLGLPADSPRNMSATPRRRVGGFL